MEDQEKGKLIDRIRKLLALSTSANENEAAAAAEKAQTLLAQHNLSMAEIKASDSDEMKNIVIDSSVVTSSHPWRRPLGKMVGEMYFCSYYYTIVRGKSTNTHSFVGADHNVAVALIMFKYLLETIDRLARQGALQVPPSERSPYRVAFRSSCSVRLCHRIMDRIAAAKRGELRSETGNALVLASLYDRAKNVVDAFMKNRSIAPRVAKQSLATTIHAKGGADGYAAGNKIGLDDQLGKSHTARLT